MAWNPRVRLININVTDLRVAQTQAQFHDLVVSDRYINSRFSVIPSVKFVKFDKYVKFRIHTKLRYHCLIFIKYP